MRKLVKRTVTLLSTFILCMAMSMTAFAGYDPNTDPMNDVGDFLVDNYTQRGSTVILYVYADTSDNVVLTEGHGVDWIYFDGIKDYSEKTDDTRAYGISFPFKPSNRTVYATLPKGEVWVYQFSIENGLYLFGADQFLTNKLEAKFFEPKVPREEKLRYVENETIQLYTRVSGWSSNNDRSFATQENYDLYAEWAKENEAKLAERNAPGVIEEVETITVEEMTTVEETVEEKESTMEEKKEEIKITPVAVKDEYPEETGIGLPFIIGGIAFVAFVIIGVLCTRRK